MSLNIKITVTSTDVPEYKLVEFGTYEAEFEIEEMLKAYPKPFIWEVKVHQKAGITTDNRRAFLDGIQIKPRMMFGKPVDVEDPLNDLVVKNPDTTNAAGESANKEQP